MSDKKTAQQEKEEKDFRALIWERTFTLITAALSLVAALAWNDAIQSLFRSIFGEAASLYAKFFYAIIVTVLSVLLIARLSKASKKINGKLNAQRKED